MTNYKQAKMLLRSVSISVKIENRNDKPLIRQVINDTCDELVKGLKLSNYHANLLSNYACTLHPKN